MVSMNNFIENALIASTPDLLIAAHSCSDPNPHSQVTALEWSTGQIRWFSSIPPTELDIALDEPRKAVYVSGSEYVQALSMFDGKLLWTNRSSSFIRTAHPIQVLSDGRVLVYTHLAVQQINPVDGSLQDFPLPDATFLFDGVTAYSSGPIGQNQFLYIQAQDVSTRKVKWIANVKQGFMPDTENIKPFAVDNLLIYRTFGSQTSLFVLDKNTGKSLWDIEATDQNALVSNAIVSDGILYVLDSQARLLLLNAQTGKQKGIIEFRHPKQDPDGLLVRPGAIGGSLIAVQGNKVAIHFADTQSLMVIELDLSNITK